MIKAMYTAAAGMTAQQTEVDVIAKSSLAAHKI